MQRKLIAGNWKMCGRREPSLALARAIADFGRNHAPSVDILICPPFTLLSEVERVLQNSPVSLGAQNCASQEEGAYTGDICAQMLTDAGCKYVILGHSERRQYHMETDETVRAKAEIAIRTGLVPIICVGETLAQREAGKEQAVVFSQIRDSRPTGSFIVAYEPVWAIGTGKTPTLAEIEAMHACIHQAVGERVKVLYGGSVKPQNARDIFSISGVDGALVGGASLVAEDFCRIIEAAGTR